MSTDGWVPPGGSSSATVHTDGDTIQGTGASGSPIALRQVHVSTGLSGLGTAASPLVNTGSSGGGGGGGGGLPSISALTSVWTSKSALLALDASKWTDMKAGVQMLTASANAPTQVPFVENGMLRLPGPCWAYSPVAAIPQTNYTTIVVALVCHSGATQAAYHFGDGSAIVNCIFNGSPGVLSWFDSSNVQINAFTSFAYNQMLIFAYENNNGAVTLYTIGTDGTWTAVPGGTGSHHPLMGGQLIINATTQAGAQSGVDNSWKAVAVCTGAILSNSDKAALGAWMNNPVGSPLVNVGLSSPHGTIQVSNNSVDPTAPNFLIDVAPSSSYPVPYAPNLPVGPFRAGNNSSIDTSTSVNAALVLYGHLALEIGNLVGKSDGPPGYNAFADTAQYFLNNTILVPRAGTLEGRNTGLSMGTLGASMVTPKNSAVGVWPIWSDGAQQFNSQRLAGLRVGGLGDANPTVHSVGIFMNQCNRMIAHDIMAHHCSQALMLMNSQYGNVYDGYSSSSMIGITSMSWGGQNGQAGELDCTEWGPFYNWAQADVTNNRQGIGFLQVHDSGTQTRPYRIRGLWLRAETVPLALCRAPWARPVTTGTWTAAHPRDVRNAVFPGYVVPDYPGFTLDIDGGSSEYSWGGLGGEDELCVNYYDGHQVATIGCAGDGQWYSVPLGTNTGSQTVTVPAWGGFLHITPASGQTLTAVGATTARGTLDLLGVDGGYLQTGFDGNGAPLLARYPLVGTDVVHITWSGGSTAPQVQFFSHAYFDKVPIQHIRGGLFYTDFGLGLQIDNYSLNNNSAQILFHQEDMSFVRIHRLIYGGAGIRGNLARGPNARIEFMGELPIGFVRTIWENVGRRPSWLADTASFGSTSGGLQQQQQCVCMGSFGIPKRNSDWDLPIPGDAVAASLTGGSGTTWTNNSGFRVQVSVNSNGANMTGGTLNGLALTTGNRFWAEPGDVFSMSWSSGGPPTFTYARPIGCFFSPINSVSSAIPDRSIPTMTASNSNVTVDMANDTDFSGNGETWAGLPPWMQGSARARCGRLTFHNAAAGHTYKSETDFASTAYFGGGVGSTAWGDGVGQLPEAATGDAGQVWQIARMFFKLVGPSTLSKVRLQVHLRRGGFWLTGCSPMRNSRVRSIPVGASGTHLRDPFSYAATQFDAQNENYGGWPGPTMWGFYPDYAAVSFSGFSGLSVTSTNFPSIGNPWLQEGVGGSANTGPYLIGLSNSHETSVFQPDSTIIYNYSGSSSPSIGVKATHPEGISLWQGQWTCCDILWNDNADAQYCVSLCDIPSADTQILYKGLLYMRCRPQQRDHFNHVLHGGFYW